MTEQQYNSIKKMDYTSQEELEKDVESLVGQELTYYGLRAKIDCVAKYVKLEDLAKAGFKAVYIVEYLVAKEGSEEQYMYADNNGLAHSYELENNIKSV